MTRPLPDWGGNDHKLFSNKQVNTNAQTTKKRVTLRQVKTLFGRKPAKYKKARKPMKLEMKSLTKERSKSNAKKRREIGKI